jgi:hypothetical protein
MTLATAGQSGVALDQWFEATTHTFNSNCVSAADEAGSAALWEAALASQRGSKMNCRISFQAGE